MRMIHDPYHPANMTEQQRRSELASILARGLLRLNESRTRNPLINSPESARNFLEPHAEKRLSGPTG